MYGNPEQIGYILVDGLGRGVAWGLMITLFIKLVFYGVSSLLALIPKK